ncbi:N-6 DNA methylase [Sulfitobacter sp. BDSS02]|nr:N-6 DNA methylase [Sulfitobacter sp. BDSS02]
MLHFDPVFSAASIVDRIALPEHGERFPALRGHLDTLRKLIKRRVRLYSDVNQQDVVRAFTLQVVRAWWRAKCDNNFPMPALRQPACKTPVLDLDTETMELLTSFGRDVAVCPAPDTAYQIGLLYTQLLPQQTRRKQSLYYTPPALASQLVKMAGDAGANFSSDRVLEPSCGGGVVLTTVLLEMAAAAGDMTADEFLRIIPDRLVGFEIDPFGAWLAQVMADGALLYLSMFSGVELPALVQCRDGLAAYEGEKFDLVVGNPPFGKKRLNDPLRTRFGRSICGAPNLYGLFLDQAAQLINEDGRISFITPTGYLAGASFKKLRSVLRTEVHPDCVAFLEQRKGVFEDVSQSIVLSVFRGRSGQDRVRVARLDLSPRGQVKTEALGDFNLPASTDAPWVLPRNLEQAALVSGLPLLSNTLSDWGYAVRTGPVIWNRYKERLSVDSAPGSMPLIWAESIKQDGSFEWSAARKGGQRWFRLEAGEESLTCPEPCVLVQRTTSPEQPRRLIAALLPQELLGKHGAVVVENHVNVIAPVDPEPAVPLETAGAFLGSKAADEIFRCMSGSTSVSATELRAMPLPPAKDLTGLTQRIAHGASRDEIEHECWRLVNCALA